MSLLFGCLHLHALPAQRKNCEVQEHVQSAWRRPGQDPRGQRVVADAAEGLRSVAPRPRKTQEVHNHPPLPQHCNHQTPQTISPIKQSPSPTDPPQTARQQGKRKRHPVRERPQAKEKARGGATAPGQGQRGVQAKAASPIHPLIFTIDSPILPQIFLETRIHY